MRGMLEMTNYVLMKKTITFADNKVNPASILMHLMTILATLQPFSYIYEYMTTFKQF